MGAAVLERESLDTNLRSSQVGPVVAALSRALDLSTGQPAGHSMRACILGMRIAREAGLPGDVCKDLFYSLLLKDCGCSSNASKTFHAFGSDDLKSKRDVKTTDWTRLSWETLNYALSHVASGKPCLTRVRALFHLAAQQKTHAKDVIKIRCERGASLARSMGLSDVTALAILNLDEHWDGRGHPDGLQGADISVLARVMLLAQTLEVYFAAEGGPAAVEVANRRRGSWFDPALVDAVNSLAARGGLWADVGAADPLEACLAMEGEPITLDAGKSSLENICLAFGSIVDAKSPYTYNHSLGVAKAAVAISKRMGLSTSRVEFVRHAALLHDLGKLGISNAILEKPASLNEQEWRSVKRHPMNTWTILRAIPGFGEMSEVAGSHHEKLNGTGYFRGVSAENLSAEARILAVADVFDALSARRPYRDGLPLGKVFEIMRKDAPHALDGACLEALEQTGGNVYAS